MGSDDDKTDIIHLPDFLCPTEQAWMPFCRINWVPKLSSNQLQNVILLCGTLFSLHSPKNDKDINE